MRLIDDIDSARPLGSYAEADPRLGHMVTDAIELYVSGANLLRDSHVESNDPQRSQRPRRSLYGGARVRL